MTAQEGKLPFFRSIRGKLLLAFLGLTLVPLVAVSWIAWARAQEALKQAAYDKLIAVRTIKKAQVEEYFIGRQEDMATLLETVDLLYQEAFSKLVTVQSIKKEQIEQFFSEQQAVVTVLAQNSNLSEMYDALIYYDESAVDPTLPFPAYTTDYYSMTASYDEFLTEYAETYGCRDLLFICANHGHVMYTVAEESDIGVNLSSSTLGDGGLSRLWREVTTNENLTVVDFEPYVPSGGAWTSFVGTPVYNLDGQLVGVFAVKVAIDPINVIVQERTDMGEAGETFLVAREPDGRITLRSDRPTVGDGEHVVGYDITDVAPQYVRDALNGETGVDTFIEDDGRVDIVSYGPLNIEGLDWAIISKIDVEEALAPRIEGRHGDFFTQYQELYGYQDLFLINPEGYVFYSVAQKPDYQTNLLDGPYSESNLGQLVGQVLETGQLGLTDFDSYAPSNGDLAAFIAQPVIRDQGGGNRIEIVVAIQLPIDGVNSIMQEVAGLGDSGEIYLVGPDNRMRSDSSRSPETHSVAASFAGTVEENGVDTEASRLGLDGYGGMGVIPNYQDQMVVSAWDVVDVSGLNWVIIAEQGTDDAFAAANDLGNMLALTSVGLELFLIVVIVWVAGTVARPVLQITDVAQSIAQGNLNVVAEVQARDETSVLASAFNQMVSQLRDMLHNEQEQREYLESTIREYVEYMEAVGQGDLTLQMDIDGNGTRNDMLSVLGHTLNRTTATIQDMTRQIHNAVNNLTSSAAEILAATTQQASGASQQSAAISQTTTTVDELKTIAEQSVTRAQDVAGASQRTVEVSRAGQRSVEEIIQSMRQIKARVEGIAENILALSEQTQQIGDIISTVNDIAAQSNILALNASVEAARAGEYGKGFAVVAVEVRNLAEQSRQATAQVRTILSDIQKATNATVMATEEGTKGVDEGVRLTEQAGGAIVQLAGVIQESAQAAAQMVAGGRQQAAGVEQMALAMQNINQSTVQSLASTRQAEKAAQELNELARSLTEIVEQYRL